MKTDEAKRSLSWVNTISGAASYNRPASFSQEELLEQENLFGHRAALFYTATENFPREQVGKGPLDVLIPVATPDYNENDELRATRIPRFWVDLIQRQTFKIRWTPIIKAKVNIIRYDYYKIRNDHLAMSIKAPLDALKVSTSGRFDGVKLHYFGAIVDDGPEDIVIEWNQELVDHPGKCGTRIIVEG